MRTQKRSGWGESTNNLLQQINKAETSLFGYPNDLGTSPKFAELAKSKRQDELQQNNPYHRSRQRPTPQPSASAASATVLTAC